MSKSVAAALILIAALGHGGAARAAGARIAVVAAENFYGDIARQVAGDHAAVVSIINSPNQDTHLFEVTPGVVRQVAAAQIVILNGAGYDPWMEKLLAASSQPEPIVVNAAELVGYRPGSDPHIWHAPATMPAVAAAISSALIQADPDNAADYAMQFRTTLSSLAEITQRVADLRAKYAGTAVTATEPVFDPMAEALALTMRNKRFQLAVMNDTEPSARDLAAFEKDLYDHRVEALIYNRQVSSKLADRLRDIAIKAKIPVVGVTETMPANVSYQKWLLDELEMLDRALRGPKS